MRCFGCPFHSTPSISICPGSSALSPMPYTYGTQQALSYAWRSLINRPLLRKCIPRLPSAKRSSQPLLAVSCRCELRTLDESLTVGSYRFRSGFFRNRDDGPYLRLDHEHWRDPQRAPRSHLGLVLHSRNLPYHRQYHRYHRWWIHPIPYGSPSSESSMSSPSSSFLELWVSSPSGLPCGQGQIICTYGSSSMRGY